MVTEIALAGKGPMQGFWRASHALFLDMGGDYKCAFIL